ncbi:MAG: ChbG/HpnK family deacetylase [Chryseolinea sp.]
MLKYLLILLCSAATFAQTSLPRSTPEAEGVSPQGIINFLDAAAKSSHEFHSIMVVRHGKVVTEGWWNPYAPSLKHTLYSVSKSFAATAIGFAVSDKKLSVEDKVISFFPDDLPATISPNLEALRIKHLLSMSVGHDKDATGVVRNSTNWSRAFLSLPIEHEPGTKFVYNSVATYMLSAIVQKVTGESVLDYLKPRLFAPLSITGMDWETDPLGVNVGGWGLRLKTEDMAKFGQLFLQKGKWNGKQILPEAWIEEASTKKIDQNPNATQVQKDSSEWLQGYGYQMWRSRHNSYRADGAYGQYILVFPEQDAVVAITAETSNMQDEINLVFKHILPALSAGKSSGDRKSSKMLKTRLASLALPIRAVKPNATAEVSVAGKTFAMVTNDRKLESVSMNFKDGTSELTLNTDSAVHKISFGNGKWIQNETVMYGPYLVAGAIHNRVGLPPFKIAGSYTWTDDKTIVYTLRYIESPHHEVIKCSLNGDEVDVEITNSFDKNVRSSKGILKKSMANAPRLIVRGDDMGFSHSGNEALIKSYREGIETSIEVIVPSPWFPETVKMLQQNPRVDVGLHFAITSEWDNIKWRPLTDCPTLKNEDGYFYPMLFKNKNYPGQAITDHAWRLEDLEKELRAQIKMALKYIPRLSHISGHMGSTGFDPMVKQMVAKVAAEFNLATVDADPGKNAFSYAHADLSHKNTEERIQAFIDMVNKLEDGKTYVFVEHPGLNNDELKAISHIGYTDVAEGRQDVTTIFTSEKVREAIERRGVDLVSYKEALAHK